MSVMTFIHCATKRMNTWSPRRSGKNNPGTWQKRFDGYEVHDKAEEEAMFKVLARDRTVIGKF